jgi:hypothetical protein
VDRRLYPLILAGAVLAGAAGLGIGRGLAASDSCFEETPPCPSALDPTELDAPWQDNLVGLAFSPPPTGSEPAVSASDALDIAWKESAIDAKQQQAILALAPKGGTFPDDLLVWIVRYDGGCVEPIGGRVGGKHPGCAVMPVWTMIDATTGEFLITWAHAE